MAVKLLHSSDPDYGVSEFLKWLNSWDRKGNHLSIQHLKGRNSCNLCLTWLSKLVNQQYENFWNDLQLYFRIFKKTCVVHCLYGEHSFACYVDLISFVCFVVTPTLFFCSFVLWNLFFRLFQVSEWYKSKIKNMLMNCINDHLTKQYQPKVLQFTLIWIYEEKVLKLFGIGLEVSVDEFRIYMYTWLLLSVLQSVS